MFVNLLQTIAMKPNRNTCISFILEVWNHVYYHDCIYCTHIKRNKTIKLRLFHSSADSIWDNVHSSMTYLINILFIVWTLLCTPGFSQTCHRLNPRLIFMYTFVPWFPQQGFVLPQTPSALFLIFITLNWLWYSLKTEFHSNVIIGVWTQMVWLKCVESEGRSSVHTPIMTSTMKIISCIYTHVFLRFFLCKMVLDVKLWNVNLTNGKAK